MFEQGWKRISLGVAAVAILSAGVGTSASPAAISLPGTTTVPGTTTTVTVPQPSQITDGVTKVVTKTPPVPAPAPKPPPVSAPRTPSVTAPSATVKTPAGSVRTPSVSVGAGGGGGGGGIQVGAGGTSVSVGGGGGGTATNTTDTVRRVTGGGGGGGGTASPGGGLAGTAPGSGGDLAAPGSGPGAPAGGPGGTRSLARSVPSSGRISAGELVTLVTQLQGCLTALPPLQRDFLIFRAGLDGGGTRSISQLSRALGVSPARAQAIQRSAVRGLRSASLSGSCSGGTAYAYSAGLFASPALLGSPLGVLFGPGEGRNTLQTATAGTGGAATPARGARPTLGEALRDLGGDGGAPPLIPAMAILLFLAASIAALMREARRSI